MISDLRYTPMIKNYDICKNYGLVCLDQSCPNDYIDVQVPFISGTEPTEICQVSDSGSLIGTQNMTIEAEEGIEIVQSDGQEVNISEHMIKKIKMILRN